MFEVSNIANATDKGADWRILTTEWIGNIFLWVSGTILTVSPDLAKGSWCLFFAMFIGQMLWALAALFLRKWSLLASSVFFCFLNIYGVFVRF